MKNLVRKRKKRTLGLTSKLLMLVLILAAIAADTPVARAAPDSGNKSSVSNVSLRSPISMLNPFTFEIYKIKDVSSLSTESMSLLKIDNTLRKSPTTQRMRIRIPFKPAVRSVFRPNLF